MSECPNRDCKEDLVSKINEVRYCAKEKVPKSWLWKFVWAFGLAIIIFCSSTWYTAKSAEEKATRLEKSVEKIVETVKELTKVVDKNRIEVVRNSERFKAINEKLENIKKAVDK